MTLTELIILLSSFLTLYLMAVFSVWDSRYKGWSLDFIVVPTVVTLLVFVGLFIYYFESGGK